MAKTIALMDLRQKIKNTADLRCAKLYRKRRDGSVVRLTSPKFANMFYRVSPFLKKKYRAKGANARQDVISKKDIVGEDEVNYFVANKMHNKMSKMYRTRNGVAEKTFHA